MGICGFFDAVIRQARVPKVPWYYYRREQRGCFGGNATNTTKVVAVGLVHPWLIAEPGMTTELLLVLGTST